MGGRWEEEEEEEEEVEVLCLVAGGSSYGGWEWVADGRRRRSKWRSYVWLPGGQVKVG